MEVPTCHHDWMERATPANSLHVTGWNRTFLQHDPVQKTNSHMVGRTFAEPRHPCEVTYVEVTWTEKNNAPNNVHPRFCSIGPRAHETARRPMPTGDRRATRRPIPVDFRSIPRASDG